MEKSRQELDDAGTSEKELWSELLRLARTNFSECYQVIAHIKLVRLFVESVLRYGLPADYYAVALKVSESVSFVFTGCASETDVCSFAFLFPLHSLIQSESAV